MPTRKYSGLLHPRVMFVVGVVGTVCTLYAVPAIMAQVTLWLLLGQIGLWGAFCTLLCPVLVLVLYLKLWGL